MRNWLVTPAPISSTPIPPPFNASLFEKMRSDAGSAEVLTDAVQDRMKFDDSTKQWLIADEHGIYQRASAESCTRRSYRVYEESGHGR